MNNPNNYNFEHNDINVHQHHQKHILVCEQDVEKAD